MLPIYEGIPELFDYVIGLVKQKSQRNSYAIKVFEMLGDIVKATDHAMFHYLTLTLSESFLQNSSRGTPYQKWSEVTNENFQRVDQSIKPLLPVIPSLLMGQINPLTSNGVDDVSSFIKYACHWSSVVDEEYISCAVDRDEPLITVSAIRTDDSLESVFRTYTAIQHIEGKHPVVKKTIIDIANRSILTEIQRVGIGRVGELRSYLTEFASWLEANYTMTDVTNTSRWQRSVLYQHSQACKVP